MGEGPSTAWRERIAPDEEGRFARQAEKLAPVHAAMSARYGAGRLLHRKPLLAARGTLEILDGLPDYARHGIFAAPRVYQALARLSNASGAVQPNAKPDIRGFAVKVLGVEGAAALGGAAAAQDFLFVNQTSFGACDSDVSGGASQPSAKPPPRSPRKKISSRKATPAPSKSSATNPSPPTRIRRPITKPANRPRSTR